jgi:hypothetical protein
MFVAVPGVILAFFISIFPYMTLTPLLTLTHRRQVKDNYIILQKFLVLDRN